MARDAVDDAHQHLSGIRHSRAAGVDHETFRNYLRQPPQGGRGATQSGKPVEQGQLHEEEIAAIATALKIFNSDRHDRESDVLTIMSIKRAYSPWNSKIHGLTQMPDKK